MDSIGLVYDHDAAVHFIATRTGLDPQLVSRILHARDRFEYGMGILPAIEPEEHALVAEVRAKYPSLFNPSQIAERRVSFDAEAAFVMLDAGIDGRLVTTVIAANTAYMAKVGIVDSTAVDDYERWAARWEGAR